MNAAACCFPLSYSVTIYRPRESQAHEALIARLSHSAGAFVEFVNAMAHQLSVRRADALRMAEYVAKEHYLARW